MGTFGRSLGRELGKNTGKFVSNKVFGDSWSTPYRVSATVQKEKLKMRQIKVEAEAAKIQAEAEYDSLRLKQRFELEQNERDLLFKISKIVFTREKDEIYDVLTEVNSIFEGYQSSKVRKAAKAKILDGIFILKQINAVEESNYFQMKINNYDKKIKYILYAVLISIVLLVICFFLPMSKIKILFILICFASTIASGLIYLKNIGVNFDK